MRMQPAAVTVIAGRRPSTGSPAIAII